MALDWVWDQPEISVALSGMSNMEQVVQNVDFAARSGVGMLSSADLNIFKKAVQTFESLAPIPCTACKYCQPCPNGVYIPGIFEMYNDKMVTDNYHPSMYYMGMPTDQRAENCTECGECLEKCPQQINIPEELKKAHAELTKDAMGPPPMDNISFDE